MLLGRRSASAVDGTHEMFDCTSAQSQAESTKRNVILTTQIGIRIMQPAMATGMLGSSFRPSGESETNSTLIRVSSSTIRRKSGRGNSVWLV
mmetsp:Transcript_12693/g.29492  ORF Transcript_12693/g.29492 Transcript_12693/m.29492 type:complete len:92 (+) Transcript_12693:621-896(+)